MEKRKCMIGQWERREIYDYTVIALNVFLMLVYLCWDLFCDGWVKPMCCFAIG